ncbi:MAG: folate-binding protein [Rickettsiaceae bacterium]|nr:MAG: folate-binding protein [Rickettsiaceae bacterium]
MQVLSNRSIVELKGNDSLSFLQKQTTNDLTKHDYCYTYILSNLGRYLFDFFCYKINNDHLIIDIDSNQVQNLMRKLNFYKLRANTQIATSDDYTVFYSRKDYLSQINQDNIKYIKTYPDPRSRLLGFRSIIPSHCLKNLSLSCQDTMLSEDKYEHAIPDGTDLFYDKSIPLEYGAQQLHAIDFDKGCYIGQEVMSRVKYQGVIRKKIFKVIANEDLAHLSKGISITDSKNDIIGIFCSAYKNQGIALINEEKKLIDCTRFLIKDMEIRLEVPKWRLN